MSIATTTQPAVRHAQQASPPSAIRMLASLAGVATLSGLLLAATYQATYDIIERNREEQLRAAIFEVLPEGVAEQRPFEVSPDGAVRPLDGPTDHPVVYAGYDEENRLVGVAIEASGLGYGDIIRVLYGYDPASEELTGFKVLASRETPGLGDRIGQRPFVDNFEGLDVPLDEEGKAVRNPITVVKPGASAEPWEIDAISGATISSNAVGDMIRRSTNALLPIIQAQLEQLERKD